MFNFFMPIGYQQEYHDFNNPEVIDGNITYETERKQYIPLEIDIMGRGQYIDSPDSKIVITKRTWSYEI